MENLFQNKMIQKSKDTKIKLHTEVHIFEQQENYI